MDNLLSLSIFFLNSLPLSKKLQYVNVDLNEAIELAENVTKITTQLRTVADEQLQYICTMRY